MALNRDEYGFDALVELGNPIRSSLPDGQPAGPEVSDRLPDFKLPDATGRIVEFHRDWDQSKSAVVLYQFVIWWPPFWTQLGELSGSFKNFEDAGIKVYATSYDDQEVLEEFGEKQNIPYTLFSVIDPAVIKSYGILKDQVAPEDGFFYSIPYLGVYVTDEDGTVVAK